MLTLVLLVGGFIEYRQRGRVLSRQSAREALLLRQIQALRELTQDGDRGTLLDFKGILIVVDETLVQDMLRTVSPLDAEIGGGFHVTVESVKAEFKGGVALVSMTGTATAQGAQVGAMVTVFGSIDAVAIDPASGLLRCNLGILAVEAENADTLGGNDPVGRLSEALTEGGLAALLGPLEIPVRLDNALTIPAVDSKRLDITAETLPLMVAARRIKVFGGKLWIFVDAGLSQPPAPAKAKDVD